MTETKTDRKKIDDVWFGESLATARVDDRGLTIPEWYDDGRSTENDAMSNVATMMSWRRGGTR